MAYLQLLIIKTMSIFNKKNKKQATYNLAGGKAYKMAPELKLASALLTSFLKDQYYGSADESATRLLEFAKECDPRFAAKAAIYARNEHGMRSASHLIAIDLSKRASGQSWAKEFYNQIIRRPDDMMEIMAGLMASGAKSPTNAMKKGFAKALGRFDAYQLGKYRAANKDVKLIDIINLAHPKPTEKNAKALEMLARDELRMTDTWETKLSEAGQNASSEKEKQEKKAAAWDELLQSNKLGYFALLRNLRNIAEQAPELIPLACERLTNEKAIKKSLVLPFRYMTAIEQIEQLSIEGTKDILIALNKAIDIACDNAPQFSGKTLIALDDSGSMTYARGGQSPASIGALFSAILMKSNANCDFMQFSDKARYYTMNPMDSTLTLARSIDFRSGGTNFHSIFEAANKKYDRIIILSDMQAWMGHYTPKEAFKTYCNKYKADPFIYSFDLQGYGTIQFPQDKILCLAGFSEKSLELMSQLEENPKALLDEIEKISLD